MDRNFKRGKIDYCSVRMRKNKFTRFDGFPDQISKVSGAKKLGIEILENCHNKIRQCKEFTNDCKMAVLCLVHGEKCKTGDT